MTLKIPALERKTEIDQKTGLYNHQYFMTQFNNELQRANRFDRPCSIIMADLDLLRNINNTYGHLAGDEVLKGIADVLKQNIRDYDIVARFGGEEFAVLMPETEIEKAVERAEYLRKAIESVTFVIPTSVEPIKATMSFGVSKRENFEQSAEEILHHADTALYRSKLSGRNRTLALVNDSFLTVSLAESIPHKVMGDISINPEIPEKTKSTSEYLAASSTYLKPSPETNKRPEDEAKSSEAQPDMVEGSKKPYPSTLNVYIYITLLALLAAISLFAVKNLWIASISAYSPSDWMGFSAIAFTIILTEWFSVNLYVKNTSLSTSAVPIITLVILYGSLGTLVASTILAATAAIKFRSPVNRIIFNFSNHIIAGILINLFVHLAGVNMGSWESPLSELLMVLGATFIMFICTTTLSRLELE